MSSDRNFINRSEVDSMIGINLQGQNALNCIDSVDLILYAMQMPTTPNNFAYIQFDRMNLRLIWLSSIPIELLNEK